VLEKAARDKAARRRLGPQQRRAQLVAVGLMLLRDRPLSELALEDVAAAAGISRALPYHYFGTRTEFLTAVLEAAAVEFLQATDPAPELPPRQRLRAGIEGYLDWVAARPSEFLALTRSAAGADPALRAVFERNREALVDRLVCGAGADPADPLIRLAAVGWVALTEEAVAAWNRRPTVPRAQLIDLVEQTFWSTIGAAGRAPAAWLEAGRVNAATPPGAASDQR
jgi:AcrR family transcriptional regulator